MARLKILRDQWTHDASHEALGGLDHGHVKTQLHGDGCHLQSDVAATDDDQTLPGPQVGADALHIGDGA